MTNQTVSQKRLGGSPAGFSFSRLCSLTFAAILVTGGAAAGYAQAQPDAAKPAKPATEKKPSAEKDGKTAGHYQVHQSIEVGGRYTTVGGSPAMWDTLVNQTSGGRILGQSLEMHSLDTTKTHFFDSLSTFSTGYGGDPYDVSRLKMSKGRFYDFVGSFRRDRNYFDYNLLANSLLGPTALVPEPDSLHLFNTVRRNTDVNLTLLPLSRISFRAGFNHGTHEGPSYTTVHDGGDVQLLQWFRNGSDTYTGGVDVKVARRTTISYDQFYVYYKGDSSFQLAGANYQVGQFTTPVPPAKPALSIASGVYESLGVDTLSTATCGSGNFKTTEIFNGFANPYCSGSTTMSETAPTRTSFPTEQFRFSSRYWDKVSMNGRILYSGATSNVNNFNETFYGSARSTVTGDILRGDILTGGGSNGRLANNKRVNVNADFGIVAELAKFLSVSDAFNFWSFRTEGNSIMTSEQWNTPNTNNILTPISGITPTTATTTNTGLFLDQKIESNTFLATATVMPEFKFSAGYRFKNREIVDPGDDLTWHEDWLLLGAVVQPSRMVRINVNFDNMNAASANSATPSNTFTREAPNRSYHIRVRASVIPAKWINFAVTGNDYSAKNDDPQVNHLEHNHDFSFATSIVPMENLSLDFNFAHDDVYSRTDICYLSSLTPAGAVSTGTCVNGPAGTTPASTLVLGTGLYDAPTNFVSGAIYYSPMRRIHLGAGARMNETNGSSEELNTLMVPGALRSHYVTPFGDAEYKVASQWAWHGNWTRTEYSDSNITQAGGLGPLPSRNTSGNVLTLGVKYEF
jgi:hypothetical protein